MSNDTIDVRALREMVKAHPDEFRSFIEELTDPVFDKFGRAISVLNKVITASGEDAVVIRVDRPTQRVLVELDDKRTRLLSASRVEVRRGRPRKDSMRPVKIA